jgi:hypothetical protein
MGDKSKMRQLTAKQASTNATNSATDRSTETGATGKVQGVADQLMSTKAGSLSPWSASNYASNLDNIANTYNNIRSQGFKALGQSGFGNSPGAIASVMNTAGRNQAADTTGAYRGALNDTLNQTLTGANMEQGISGQYGGQSQNESGMAVNDAAQRIQEGSTLGDVASGIGQVAGIASNFIPGASGFGGILKRAGANNMQGTIPLAPSSTVNSSVYGGGFGGIGSPRYASTGVGAY